MLTEPGPSYRIKLTGFRTAITREYLAQLLDRNSSICFAGRKNTHVGYVVKLKPMKYAAYLMKTWHDHQIDGHHLKCQLELYRVLPIPNSRPSTPPSVSNYETVANHPAHSPNRSRTASSVQSDEDPTTPTQVDNPVTRKYTIPKIVNREWTSSSESSASTGRSTREFLFPETYHRSQHFDRRFQFSCRTVYQQVNGKSQRRYPTAIEKCCWYAAQRIGSVWRRSKSTQIDTRKPLIKS